MAVVVATLMIMEAIKYMAVVVDTLKTMGAMVAMITNVAEKAKANLAAMPAKEKAKKLREEPSTLSTSKMLLPTRNATHTWMKDSCAWRAAISCKCEIYSH